MYYLDRLVQWIILIVGFTLNTTTNLFGRSANFVILPLLYGKKKVEANIAFTSVWTSSMLTGPVIGGMLLPSFSPIGLICLDSITFLIIILCLIIVGLLLRGKENVDCSKGFSKDFLEGFQITFGTKQMRAFISSAALYTLVFAPIGYFTAFAGLGMFCSIY